MLKICAFKWESGALVETVLEVHTHEHTVRLKRAKLQRPVKIKFVISWHLHTRRTIRMREACSEALCFKLPTCKELPNGGSEHSVPNSMWGEPIQYLERTP